MSILLDATMDATWYSGADRAYYQNEATLRSTNIRGRSGTGNYLVCGCGFGHLVQALRTAGNTNTWGFDLSQYAVDQAKLLYPAIASRFVLGDARSPTSMSTVRQQTVGGPSTRLFNVIITEDLLSAQGPNKRPSEYTAQDWIDAKAEAQSCVNTLRPFLAANGRMAHIISMPFDGTLATDPMYSNGLWLFGEEWRTLLGPTDIIVRLSDLKEF